MSDVKWIKICIDIFDDEKIALIESMPEADGIIVIWFKLLCMAGKQNNGGVFMLNDKIPYTDEMLATIFRRPLNTVRLALETFKRYGMIEIYNDIITIPNWEKHQNLEKLELSREKNRQRVAKCRQKQKQIAECNDYTPVTVMQCNADRIDKDKDKDKNNIYIDEFSELWKLYPQKIGKDKALKSYVQARKSGTTFEEVKKGIEQYIEYSGNQEAKYIKHGSTWFNQKCWQDIYLAESTSKDVSFDLAEFEKKLNEE